MLDNIDPSSDTCTTRRSPSLRAKMDTITSVMLPNVAFSRPPTDHSPKVCIRIWRSGRTKRKDEMASHPVTTWEGYAIFATRNGERWYV